MSAGIRSPADNNTTSPTVTFVENIFVCFPFLITVVFTDTKFFSFSAALLDLYTSKNSSKVLTVIKIRITMILA